MPFKQLSKKCWILNPTTTTLLIALEEINYSHGVARLTGTTFASICHRIKDFKDMGIITTKKVGRMNIIEITDKGNQVREN